MPKFPTCVPDTVIVNSAEDLDHGPSVLGLDGLVQLLRYELEVGRHQCHDHVLEVATELLLQVFDQILLRVGEERS